MLKNIIFDLGGVLLTIDYNLTEQAFVNIGFDNFRDMYSQFTADELFQNFEMGKISKEEFYQKVLAVGKPGLTEKDIENAWNGMLLTWRNESLLFLETLSKKYRLFLLSNTNCIHLDAFNKMLKEQTGRDTINDLFEKAYYSHEIKLRKPATDIYLFAEFDGAIKPEETLFIDDTPVNLETAATLGFKTYLLKAGEKIEDLDYERLAAEKS